jgi:F420H(2)-dependent quinone reductase
VTQRSVPSWAVTGEQEAIRTYRGGGEQKVSKQMGFPVVLLTTRGAKSGELRTVPLGGFADGEDAWLVAASRGRRPASSGVVQEKTDREIPIVRLTREPAG